jgi:hypothetical protein
MLMRELEGLHELYRQARELEPTNAEIALALRRADSPHTRSRRAALHILTPGMRRRPRRRLLALGALIGATAVLAIAEPWQTSGDDAVARAAAVVSPKRGGVLHIRSEGHRIYTPFSEQWTAPDGSWREQHGGTDMSGPCTVEDGYDAKTHVLSTFDAGTNTIYRHTLSRAQIRFASQPNQIAQVRTWLAHGQLRSAGAALIGDRRTLRLVPSNGRRSLLGAIAYYVDARTYAPVRWQLNGTQWYDFTIYRELPGTAANLALASIRAQHPDAALRQGWGAHNGCGSG